MGSAPGGRPGSPNTDHTPFLTPARLRVVVGLAIMFFVVVLGLVGYFSWNNIAYVDTLHAHIDGALVQVRAPTAGRIVDASLDVGDAVAEHEELVTLESVGATGASPVSRILMPIRAPIAGVVTEKVVKEGDIVSAGQAIVTLVDPNDVWVTANIHESRIPQVRVGQRAHIWINTRTVRRDFWGRVEQVGQAASAVLASGRSTASGPVEVPIKVSIDTNGYELYPGMTAEVWIRINPRLR